MRWEKIQIGDSQRLLAEMRLAERQIDAGHYICHEDMKAWLLSWGKPTDLPPPTCVCGENHDESFAPDAPL